MTPTDRRKRITDVFQLAVQKPLEERRRFVETECRGDDTLMHEVESLLSEYQTSYENSQDIFRNSGASQPLPPPMQRIGKYQVTKLDRRFVDLVMRRQRDRSGLRSDRRNQGDERPGRSRPGADGSGRKLRQSPICTIRTL